MQGMKKVIWGKIIKHIIVINIQVKVCWFYILIVYTMTFKNKSIVFLVVIVICTCLGISFNFNFSLIIFVSSLYILVFFCPYFHWPIDCHVSWPWVCVASQFSEPCWLGWKWRFISNILAPSPSTPPSSVPMSTQMYNFHFFFNFSSLTDFLNFPVS